MVLLVHRGLQGRKETEVQMVFPDYPVDTVKKENLAEMA